MRILLKAALVGIGGLVAAYGVLLLVVALVQPVPASSEGLSPSSIAANQLQAEAAALAPAQRSGSR